VTRAWTRRDLGDGTVTIVPGRADGVLARRGRRPTGENRLSGKPGPTLVRAALLAAVLWNAAGGAAAEENIVLATRPGVTEPLFYTAAASPVRNAILFTGGAGVVAGGRNNFLLRTADRFVAGGINVAIPEVPSDHPTGMIDAFRASAEHATDIAAAIAYMRRRSPVPVWLVGTSRGTISAANGAVRIGPPRVAGLVLTSTVWADLSSVTPLNQVRVPTLVVHNRDDGCAESPFAAVAGGMAALRAAPVRDLIAVSGGVARGAACQALSPHGYYGIEDQAVPPIVAWIEAH